jgi:hypothetical protein
MVRVIADPSGPYAHHYYVPADRPALPIEGGKPKEEENAEVLVALCP